ncbi:isochorismatase family protein [Corynebacterium sp. CCM 9204]|uniref:isochorismatase family protein n=1 Tax=Corynebacterium sp. CCM 9204 TaxID=3057616 RepID=UPI00352461DE
MAIPLIAPYPLSAACPPDAPVPEPVVDWSVDPGHAALLVHDMQAYFLAAYDRSREPVSTMIPNIRALIDAFDAAGAPVFYSVQPPAQAPARRGLLTDFWGTGISDAEDAAVIPELAPRAHHHLITKWRYSAFERTDLRQALSFARRNQLVVTGVYAHMGCQVSAADAFMNDIQPFLVADAVADFSADEHRSAVQWVGRRAGVALRTGDVLEQFTTPGKGE